MAANTKFCSSCGAPIVEQAVMCPRCGCATANFPKQETNVSSGPIVASYFLAILMPFIGLIMGIYLLAKNRAGHGITVLVISLCMFYFWWAFWEGASR